MAGCCGLDSCGDVAVFVGSEAARALSCAADVWWLWHESCFCTRVCVRSQAVADLVRKAAVKSDHYRLSLTSYRTAFSTEQSPRWTSRWC